MSERITVEGARSILSYSRKSEELVMGRCPEQHPDAEVVEYFREHYPYYTIIDHIYEDVSGATPFGLRDNLIAGLKRARDDKEIAGILVPAMDRLSRYPGAFEETRYTMTWLGKHLFVGIWNEDQRQLVRIRDFAGAETPDEQQEREDLEDDSVRTRTILSQQGNRARRAKIARLGYGGGRLRPAYFMDRVELGDGKAEFMPNSQRLQWALWMRERRDEGWTYQRIASELNRIGMRTKANYLWTPDKVYRVLCKQLVRVPEDILVIWLDRRGGEQCLTNADKELLPLCLS